MHYLGNAGQGGIGTAGSDGLAAAIWIPTNVLAPILINPVRFGDGSFQFSFANYSGLTFTAQTSTTALETNNWVSLGAATEISPGHYQFTHALPTMHRRYYRVTSP